jgi:hypothetical protein
MDRRAFCANRSNARQSQIQERPRLKHNGFQIRGMFRASAAAAALTLVVTAGAQDAARMRTPRRQVESELKASDFIDTNAATDPNLAQGPGPGPIGPGPGCNLFPAPPSVGTTVDLSYFGPPPSTTNQSLVGPVQLLKSGVVNATKCTIGRPATGDRK